METDTESISTAPDKPSVAVEDIPKVSKLVLHETIPESPRRPPEAEKKKDVDPTASAKPIAPLEQKPLQVKPEAPKATETAPKSPIKETKPTTTPTPVNGKSKEEKPKEQSSSTPAKTTAAKKTTIRPTAISVNKTTSKPPAKSPLKTPTSASDKPVSKPAAKPTAKLHEKPAVKKETPTARPGSSATRHPATSANKKPQPLKPTVSETGFVKPKPKSPTKPVHLPASLMAPTASSVSKGSSSRPAQTRPSGNTSNLSVPGRSPSRASVSTTTSTSGKTVKRQPSTISRSSRPSLGPPPKKTTDGPSKKDVAPVDEGFLARMMRPTQASSSKTTEKAPVTPPRKKASRPSFGADARREHRAPGSAKKPVRRHAESSAPSQSAHSKESSPAPADESIVISEPASEPAKTELVEETVEPVKEVEPIAVPEPKEEVAKHIPVEELKEDTTELEAEAKVVEPAREEKKAAESEAIPEEPAVDVAKDEPAAPEEHKTEEPKTEDPRTDVVDEPNVEADKVIDQQTEKTVEPVQPEPTIEEPEKTEEVLVEDEPALAKETSPAVIEETASPTETTEEPVEETATEEVTPSSTVETEKEKEEQKEIEEEPKADEKKEPETMSKEDSAAQ